MNINWKHLATTPGYKSLKAAYVRDVSKKDSLRSKKELYAHFQWVINRAKHTSYAMGTPIEEVLNGWEAKRDYSWFNYYQASNQRKVHSNSLRSIGINGYRKYQKKVCWSGSKTLIKHSVNRFIQAKQKDTSKKTKKRWTMAEKQSYRHYRRK